MMGENVLAALRARAPDRMASSFPRQPFRLHAMLTTAGCDRACDPSYDHEGIARGSFVLLQHTLAGRGRLRFEGRTQVVHPGETMLLRFPHDNRYWVEAGEAWEFFWICLNGREVQRVWREAMAAGPLVRLPEASILRLAGLCLRALAGGLATPAQASACAYEIAMLLAGELILARDDASPDERRGIERAISLCDSQAGDARLDVAALASAAGYSRHHFSRLFAQATGLSPGRALARRRMEEAARLLRLTGLPVKQVALQCGFADANNFAKAFRRHHGRSPGEVRGGRRD